MFEFFSGPGGAQVVEKEIEKARLTKTEVAVFEAILERIEQGRGLPGDSSRVRGPIWEVRIRGDRRIFRLLYAEISGANPVLLGLHFFGKKTRTTPDAAIELALRRLASYRER